MCASCQNDGYSPATRLLHFPILSLKRLFWLTNIDAASCVRCAPFCSQLGSYSPVIEVLQIFSVFVTEKKRHPCTARRRTVVCARGSAPAPTGRGERQECQRVSNKTALWGSVAGKSATLQNPAHHQRATRAALAPAIVTDRPRRRQRLGETSLQAWAIERDAEAPAGT